MTQYLCESCAEINNSNTNICKNCGKTNTPYEFVVSVETKDYEDFVRMLSDHHVYWYTDVQFKTAPRTNVIIWGRTLR